MGQKTFQYSAEKDWNRLPKKLRAITNFKSFKTELFKYLFNADKASHFFIYRYVYFIVFTPYISIVYIHIVYFYITYYISYHI